MLNIFNQSKDQVDEHSNDLIIGGLLVEAASIDGEIIDIEIAKIKESLHLFSGIDKETSDKIIHSCLEKVDEPNSFHYPGNLPYMLPLFLPSIKKMGYPPLKRGRGFKEH